MLYEIMETSLLNLSTSVVYPGFLQGDGIGAHQWIQLNYALDKGWAVVAQWITPLTLNYEVSGSNLLAVAVVPLGKALFNNPYS